MWRFVLSRQYVQLLKYIQDNAPVGLIDCAKATRLSYVHLSTVLVQFEQEGLVSRKGMNAKLAISLTEKGTYIIRQLRDIEQAADRWEEVKENEDRNKAARSGHGKGTRVRDHSES